MMKKIFAATLVLVVLLSASDVLALGITAGTVRILVDVGGTSGSTFGLVNNGNETITVAIRAEGDAAQFIEVPESLELQPQELTYVTVKVTIPSTYDGYLGGNITGYIYAVQEGEPGQVQINVQAKKAVQLLIPQYGGRLPETLESQSSSQSVSEESNIATGMMTMPTLNPILLVPIGLGILAVIAYFVFSRFDISIKSKRR
jgi:hypothetical protein